MSDWETFLEDLSKAPLEERVIIFRAETLRPLHMSLGIARLLQLEIEVVPELPDDIENWSQKLLHHLEEIQQLLDALVKKDEKD